MVGMALENDVAASVSNAMPTIAHYISYVTEAADTASLVYRNLGDSFERTSLTVVENVHNLVEYVKYPFTVLAAVISDSLDATLAALRNFGKNAHAIFDAIVEYIKSGGAKPIRFNLTPLFEGCTPKG